VQTNVLIKGNKNKLCPYKKLSVFYNSRLKTFGSHLVYNTYLFSLSQLYSIGNYAMIVCESVMDEARQAASEGVPTAWQAAGLEVTVDVVGGAARCGTGRCRR
jgi:hypothetical protein